MDIGHFSLSSSSHYVGYTHLPPVLHAAVAVSTPESITRSVPLANDTHVVNDTRVPVASTMLRERVVSTVRSEAPNVRDAFHAQYSRRAEIDWADILPLAVLDGLVRVRGGVWMSGLPTEQYRRPWMQEPVGHSERVANSLDLIFSQLINDFRLGLFPEECVIIALHGNFLTVVIVNARLAYFCQEYLIRARPERTLVGAYPVEIDNALQAAEEAFPNSTQGRQLFIVDTESIPCEGQSGCGWISRDVTGNRQIEFDRPEEPYKSVYTLALDKIQELQEGQGSNPAQSPEKKRRRTDGDVL